MINFLKRVFKDVLGKGLHFEATDPKHLGIRLSVLMSRQYDLFIAQAVQPDRDFLIAKPCTRLPGRVIEQHYLMIKQQVKKPVLFYFDKLNTRQREQLIRRGVQFLVADRFLFAPELGLLGPVPIFQQRWEDMVERKSFSASAEVILIGQLIDGRYEGFQGKEIAKALGLDTSTVSRALAQLEKQGYLDLERDGIAKHTRFIERQELWDVVKNLLTNPVREELQVGKLPKEAVKAGVTALSEESLLADLDMPVYAIYKKDFDRAVTAQGFEVVAGRGKGYALELWNRNPGIYATEKRVDPISLYLTLRDNQDERIQKELDGLLQRLGLEADNE